MVNQGRVFVTNDLKQEPHNLLVSPSVVVVVVVFSNLPSVYWVKVSVSVLKV